MSYRKITVDGTIYEYVIGRTTIKIKGVGLFPVVSNGYIRGNEQRVITPEVIKHLITGTVLPPLECQQHGHKSHRLMADPFAVEILGKQIFQVDCPTCYEMSAEEI